MLAGCSSTLLSPRHKLRIDASVQLQSCHFQLQDKHCHPQQKMGTQRLDLPCGFSSRKDPLRMALSVEKPPPGEARRSSCSFRRNPVTTSSMAAQTPSWGGIDESHGRPWDRRRSLKRFHERGSCDDDRAKRTRTGGGVSGLVEVDGEVWLPRSTRGPPPVEEDKVFLVPNAASFPLPASTSHALSDSSSSSAAYASSPEPTKDSSGNGTSAEQQGLELLSLLTSCAESISSGNYEGMTFFLARLGETATPLGTPLQRVVAYYTEALALRVVKLRPHIFSIAPPKSLVHPTEDDDAVALRLLNCITPVLKFLHFTMNERLLKAFEGRDRVHIIDLDIKQGLQWPSLLQSLASRPSPPSHLRITGVGESRQDLQDTGAALARLAESLNLPFEFHAVADRLEDVRLWMLHVKREECVAVNCVLTMHKALSDESGKAFMDLLGLIRSTRPEIVVMAEQEAKHNDPNWETRFSRSLSYYAAIFDSMDYALPRDSPARIKVEQVFAREIRNAVACEGGERTERHENFDRWRKLMEDGGFKCLGIGEREMLQSRMILRMYSRDKYAIDNQGEEGDGLTLRWSDQPLYTVSAWAPTDVAGSSSTERAVRLTRREDPSDKNQGEPLIKVAIMTMEHQIDEKQDVTIHRVRTTVPNVSEEISEEFLLDFDDLAVQEIVYQSFQKNSHEHQRHASVSESRSNHEIGQSSHGGSSSVTTDILLQFTSDEAIAQQYEILDNLPADASFSALYQSEAESSTMNGGSSSANSPGQVTRQDIIDPDQMSYEQLQSLEEEMGNESRGLSEELISCLRDRKHRCGFFSKGKNEECVICKTNYRREWLITLPCKHCYHSRCIIRWLEVNKFLLKSFNVSSGSSNTTNSNHLPLLTTVLRHVPYAKRRYLDNIGIAAEECHETEDSMSHDV
ncbi:unnamed protein product [Musa textilis]